MTAPYMDVMNENLIIIDPDKITMDFVGVIRTISQDVATFIQRNAVAVIASKFVFKTLKKVVVQSVSQIRAS